MSEFVIKYILSAIDMNRRETVDWAEVLEKAAENANIEVRNFLKRLSQKAGTTLTVILIDNWLATVLHIGDSRLYLLRNRVLELLTDDHTGVVPVDDASTEDFIETRVILSRAIGKSNVIKPDIFEVPLEIGDRFILCTDGVTKTVDHEELALIAEDHPLQQMPAHLMQLTHDRRTTDNASVVVIDVASKPEMNSSAKPDKQARVFVANNRRSIRYEKLSRIRNEDLKRQEAPESREEGGFPGCGCLTLTLLVLSLFLIGFWSSGLLVEFLNSQANTATPTPTEVVITETRTPTATFTATGTATSTATVTVTTTSTVTAIPIINSRVTDVPFTVEAVPAIQSQTPVETDSVPDEEVTVSPQPFVTNPVIGTVITVEVVPATQVLNPIATITVRPTNVPR